MATRTDREADRNNRKGSKGKEEIAPQATPPLLPGVLYSSFPIIAACLEVRAGCHEVSSRVYVMRTEYSQHTMIMMKMVSTSSGDEVEVGRSE